MGPSTRTIDAHFASLPPKPRAALARIRRAIRAAAPEAEEGFRYGMPAFRLNGRPVAAFSASANHGSCYPMSGAVVESLARGLAGHDTSNGTVRLPPSRPRPATLVRKLVRACAAEIAQAARKAR